MFILNLNMDMNCTVLYCTVLVHFKFEHGHVLYCTVLYCIVLINLIRKGFINNGFCLDVAIAHKDRTKARILNANPTLKFWYLEFEIVKFEHFVLLVSFEWQNGLPHEEDNGETIWLTWTLKIKYLFIFNLNFKQI